MSILGQAPSIRYLISDLLLGSAIVSKIANQIGAQKEKLHQHSTWRTGKVIMDYPYSCAQEHELAQELIFPAKRGHCAHDSTGASQN